MVGEALHVPKVRDGRGDRDVQRRGAVPGDLEVVRLDQRGGTQPAGVPAASGGVELQAVDVRILMVVADHGSGSLGTVAESAGIHISKASRVCDRMVGAGLLNRADDPADRRLLTLTLTAKGRRVVRVVVSRRRVETERILARMTRARRAELVSVLNDFAAAGNGVPDEELWLLGWPT